MMWRQAPYTYCSGDMAEYIQAAYRIVGGEKPYSDFWLLFPPLEVYFPASVMHLTGNTNMFKYAESSISILNGLMVFILFKLNNRTMLHSLISGALMLIWGGKYLYMTICLLSLLSLVQFLNSKQKAFLIISALLCALSFGFRFYQTLPALLAVIVILIHNRKTVQGYSLTLFLIISSALPLLLLILIVPDVSSAAQAIFIDALQHGTAFQIHYLQELKSVFFQVQQYFNQLHNPSEQYSATGFVFQLLSHVPLLLVYAVPLFVITCFIVNQRILQSTSSLYLFLWGIFFLPYAWRFANADHLFTAYTPLFIFVLMSLSSLPNTGCYYKARPYILCLILIYLGVDVFNNYKTIPKKSMLIQTPMLSLHLSNDGYFKQINSIIDDVTQMSVSKNDVVFMTWSLPAMYVLCQKQNPVYYDSPIDFILKPDSAKEKILIQELSDSDIKIIIIEEGNLTGLSDRHNIKYGMPLFYSHLHSTYELSKQIGRYHLYSKKVI